MKKVECENYINYCPFCGGKVTEKKKSKDCGSCAKCGAEFKAEDIGLGMISVIKSPKKKGGYRGKTA